MAERIDVESVNKFHERNYQQWKFQMKCALKAKGLYEIASGEEALLEEPPETREAWLTKDAVALFTVSSAMDVNQITLIENCETSKEIFDKLDSVYQQKTEFNKMMLHDKFHQYKMDPNDSMIQHISKVENIGRQIKESGETLSDVAIITKILGTFPTKFRNFRQAWLSMSEEKQTLTKTARLLDEEVNLTSSEQVENAFLASKNTNVLSSQKQDYRYDKNKFDKRKITCYQCGNKGHFARECHSSNSIRRQNNAESSRDQHQSAFNVEKFDLQYVLKDSSDGRWTMDSGASAHMTHRRDFLYDYEELDCDNSVVLGNDQGLPIKGKETVKIKKK